MVYSADLADEFELVTLVVVVYGYKGVDWEEGRTPGRWQSSGGNGDGDRR